MQEQICVKCGKVAVKNALCSEHFRPGEPLLRIRPSKQVQVCRKCGRFFSRGKEYGNLQDAVKAALSIAPKNKFVDVSVKVLERGGGKLFAEASAFGSEAGIPIKEIHKETLVLSKTMCLNCSRLSGGYNEAVIQYRGKDKKEAGEISKKCAFVKETEYGHDFYFLRKGDAAKIAKILRKDYTVKKTRKLMGQKKDRRIYKDFYSVR